MSNYSTGTGGSSRRILLNRLYRIAQRVMNVRRRLGSSRFVTFIIKRFVDLFLYFLGPLLIILASGIIVSLTYTFFTIILPLMCPEYGFFCFRGFLHTSFVIFVVFNIVFNYFLCVCTKNTGKKYEIVVRELAEATGFVYPENEEEVNNAKREYEEKIAERRRARIMEQSLPSSARLSHASTENATGPSTSTLRNRPNIGRENSMTQLMYGWMLLGPQEWGFCLNTHQPKPPRSHYDHVTSKLVLNMDHYCPWMFNAVGFFNYRYFCNFLLFVFVGMLYGTIVLYQPFQNSSNELYSKNIQLSKQGGSDSVQHIIPLVPTPSEKVSIAFSFMMCSSVGLAVFCLFATHIYFIFTGQTTIEYHANSQKKRFAQQRGITWINPYDLGAKRNWQQVYGCSHPLIALLPSCREPEFLPVPIIGERGRRFAKDNKSSSSIQNREASDVNIRITGEQRPIQV